MTERTKFRFPRLKRISCERFSLYAQRPDIDLVIRPGVFCLAGANGIGKSTFLAAVNLALTGRVPTAERHYVSTGEYFERSAAFARTFFDGRIEEGDREVASISIEFDVADKHFALSRGVFEPDTLRALRITNGSADGPVVLDGAEMSETQRQAKYGELLPAAIGLQTYDQFVFIQHFVLTFDESRNLLFWNSTALESALYLAFDADPAQQISAETYRREMEKADSRGRNYRFHALRVQKRIGVVHAALGPEPLASDEAFRLEAAYQALLGARDSALELVTAAEAASMDAETDFANASAALVTLRNEYAGAFGRHIRGSAAAAQHPVVVDTITDLRCVVCGSTGPAVAEAVQRKIAAHSCPLCEMALNTQPIEDLGVLRGLDANISEARGRVALSAQRRDRLAAELVQARRGANAAAAAVREFEARHDEIARRVQGQAAAAEGPLREQLSALQSESNVLLEESKQAYEARDTWKSKLQGVQARLERQYKAAEDDFVPLFRAFAEQFLGIDLDVLVERRGTTGISLVLELRQTMRRRQHQLSESQRFFLDIALRMAIAQFWSSPESRATLFIDTPEGSLDIAYESRAGAMFAKFVRNGHDLLMTANINTSELLRKLAADCGSSRMTLVRMTEWAELSAVQLEESALFERAYAEIERGLQANAD